MSVETPAESGAGTGEPPEPVAPAAPVGPGAAQRWPNWTVDLVAALAVALSAALLYTRFGITGSLSRDEAIYAYGGLEMAHGTPPYASIFDPKSPMATIVSGLAAALARLVGSNELYAIRAAFLLCAVLTAVAVYLLVRELSRSVVSGLVSASVFIAWMPFARDALPGPDAKTPGILFLVVAMWLGVRRHWFLTGVFGMLAFLVWQPLVIYPAVALLGAGLCMPAGERMRAVVRAAAGAATPLALVTIYFIVTGAFGKFVEAAFRFPLEGVRRGKETVSTRVHHIVWVVHQYCGGHGAVLFWIGLAAVIAAAAYSVVTHSDGWRRGLVHPVVLFVVLTMLFELGYAAYDFQSYPDLYPLLPYPAIGIGLAVGHVLRVAERRRSLWIAATAVLAAAAVSLFLYSWTEFASSKAAHNDALREQRATGCAIDRFVVPGTTLYALGDPTPLVMTHRKNPDRFIYLGSGVVQWKVDHTKGGFAGWEEQIRRSHASVVVVRGWGGGYRRAIGDFLVLHYTPGYVGPWRVFVSDDARARMTEADLALTKAPTKWPHTAEGTRFTRQRCGNG